MQVAFTVPGKPKGKGRPRVTVRGKFAHAYTPKDTATYENLIRLQAAQAMTGCELMQGPVACHVTAYVSRPKGHYGTGRNSGKLKDSAPRYPTTKPDGDNVLKGVGDACNGIVYKDDSQIVDATVEKRYAALGVGERLDVVLWHKAKHERRTQ